MLATWNFPHTEFLLGSKRAKVWLNIFQNSVVDNQNPYFEIKIQSKKGLHRVGI